MTTSIFTISSGNTAPATDDNDVITGRNGPTWGGSNPNFDTGATGNPAEGDGVISAVEVYDFSGETTEKIISVLIGTLTDAVPNFIRVPKDKIGNHKNKKIIGVESLGAYNPAAGEANNTPDASLIKCDIINWAVVKDAIILKIAAANIELAADNYINLRITVRD